MPLHIKHRWVCDMGECGAEEEGQVQTIATHQAWRPYALGYPMPPRGWEIGPIGMVVCPKHEVVVRRRGAEKRGRG